MRTPYRAQTRPMEPEARVLDKQKQQEERVGGPNKHDIELQPSHKQAIQSRWNGARMERWRKKSSIDVHIVLWRQAQNIPKPAICNSCLVTTKAVKRLPGLWPATIQSICAGCTGRHVPVPQKPSTNKQIQIRSHSQVHNRKGPKPPVHLFIKAARQVKPVTTHSNQTTTNGGYVVWLVVKPLEIRIESKITNDIYSSRLGPILTAYC
jgi:hypothetical protein